MGEKTINQSIESIQATLDQIVETVESLPEDSIRWKPSDDEWSILQILSHISEATPYWIGEIKTVVADPGSEWGRGMQDSARLAAVAEPEKLSSEKVEEQVKQLKNQVEVELGGLTEEQLKKESPHRNFAKFGNKPVSFIIGHFIEEHLKGHLGQINRNISKLKQTN
ncbi:DinB family protein [Bacillus sp. 1P06AnD]|uniref:DinB family protein n=1 Tax=Bacillus sp. 1P06AnD TaxID=3132208 RepID=UPI00399F57DC